MFHLIVKKCQLFYKDRQLFAPIVVSKWYTFFPLLLQYLEICNLEYCVEDRTSCVKVDTIDQSSRQARVRFDASRGDLSE